MYRGLSIQTVMLNESQLPSCLNCDELIGLLNINIVSKNYAPSGHRKGAHFYHRWPPRERPSLGSGLYFRSSGFSALIITCSISPPQDDLGVLE